MCSMPVIGWKEVGEDGQYLRQGRTACLLLAGGEGSRLGFDGPKGAFEIFPGQSLFKLFCRRIKAAEEKAGRPLYMAIMVSPANSEATRHFFEENRFFGLPAGRFFFFEQGALPVKSEQGKILLDEKERPIMAADGNGGVFGYLKRSGVLKYFKKKGIEYLTIVPVDNPLGDPFDTRLISYHAKSGNDVTIKCVRRKEAGAQTGALIMEKGRIRIIEYLEIKNDYEYANTGLFCVSLDFIEKIASIDFPLRKIWKKGRFKEERFIFDMLAYTFKTKAICYPRDACFAPLKCKADLQGLRELLLRKKTEML